MAQQQMCCLQTAPMMCIFMFYLVLFYVRSPQVSALFTGDLVFNRAQCKAKCIEFFVKGKRPELQQVSQGQWSAAGLPADALASCLSDSTDDCSKQCFGACDQPPSQCREGCKERHGCRLGCHHLATSIAGRAGECPSPSRLLETSRGLLSATACLAKCKVDQDCYEPLEKCCTAGCSQLCVKPLYNASVPVLAPVLKPVKTGPDNGLDLEWADPYRTFVSDKNPIIFILQTRYCVCKTFNPNYLSNWQTLIMTHQFGAKLDAFESGKMYQFRLAAVAPEGTRGFGPPSEPYPSVPPVPRAPSPPRNVTDGMWRIYANGRISVMITWTEPEHYDLRISEYKVTWVLDHGFVQSDGQSLEALTHFIQTIPPERRSYVIENLEPDTSYKVQVQAISYWSDHGSLTSQPNTLFISTPSLKPATGNGNSGSPDDTVRDPTRKSEESNCHCGGRQNSDPHLDISTPEFDKGELTARILLKTVTDGEDTPYQVEWSPRVCIDSRENRDSPVRDVLKSTMQHRIFRLTRLNFNCRYLVRLTPLEQRGVGTVNPIVSCFCTPSCRDVKVTSGSGSPQCPQDKSSLPPSPFGVRFDLVDETKLNYKISWRPPQHTYSDTGQANSFAKYRVVWAPREEEPVNKEMYNDEAGFSPILDFRLSDVRVLNKNQTSLVLRRLKRATFYIVKVQTLAMSEDGRESESAPTVLYFTTKGFKNPGPLLTPSKSSAEVARYIKRLDGDGALRRTESLGLLLLTLGLTVFLAFTT